MSTSSGEGSDRVAREYPTSAFDYELPPERIAQRPADRRDASRLLVLRRDSGAVEHRMFPDLVQLVEPGDVLVLNETRVFPARLVGRKPTGAAAEVLLLRPEEGTGTGTGRSLPMSSSRWVALVRPGGKLKPGRVIDVAADLRIRIVDSTPEGARIVELETPDDDPARAIERHGRVPLPPYIEREPDAADVERYQTVYARATGSVAAPTAGLHLTPPLLEDLRQRGVEVGRLILHVGVGTFRPVEVEDPAEHRMHSEWYEVDEAVAGTLNRVRRDGGAVWAVGTTVARTLETIADEARVFHAGSGWTDIFIRPGHVFRGVDRLITNFHLPRSTLLMLVAALGGYEPVMRAYREAVAGGYRFYSYGDAMAVL